MKRISIYIPFIMLLALAIASWCLGFEKYLDFSYFRENHAFLKNYIYNNYLIAILIFSGSYIFIVSISFPGATAMTLIGGFLFGQVVGTAIVVLSATIGSCILFASTKLASQEVLKRKGSKWIYLMQKGFHTDALAYMLTLRLIPLFPFFAINLVAGILQIKFRDFFYGTLLGIIPATFIYVTLGDGLHDFAEAPQLSPKIVFSLIGLGIVALLPVVYKKLRKV